MIGIQVRLGVVGPHGGIVIDLVHDGVTDVLELPLDSAVGLIARLAVAMNSILQSDATGATPLPVVASKSTANVH